MHLPHALAPRRLAAAGAFVTFALLSAACSSDSVSRINAPPLRLNSSSGHSSGGSAGSGPSLGAASGFAILSAADNRGGAVTCVGPAAISGNVGSSGLRPSVAIPADCTLDGTITAPVSASVVAAFDSAYAALAREACTQTISTEAFIGPTQALSVGSGVICFPTEVTFTNTTLTLTGNGPWLFKVGSGTAGSGALTGTNLNVVMPSGAAPCDVTWWVRAGATMTTDNDANGTHFVGTILAGAAITVTGATIGTFDGRALAKAAVSITGGTFTGCGAAAGQVCKERGDRVTGGGWIIGKSGGKANFAVSGGIDIKKNAFLGQLEYDDNGKRKSDDFEVKGTGVTAYTALDLVTRRIEGTAKVNGKAGFTYRVDVTDNGEPGRNDVFAISIWKAGALVYSASGKLGGGNNQLHKAHGRACEKGDKNGHGDNGHHGDDGDHGGKGGKGGKGDHGEHGGYNH